MTTAFDSRPAWAIWQGLADVCQVITGHLARQVSVEGRVSMQLLDALQLEVHELIGCLAELQASRSLLRWADVVRSPVAWRLAAGLHAECCLRLQRLVTSQPRVLGVSPELLADTLASEETRAFIEAWSGSACWDTTARLIRTEGLGPVALDGSDQALRDELRDFVERRLPPAAARAHREGSLVPPELVDELASLGCFGLSVPMSLGGLLPDAGPDHASLFVAAEELARGGVGVGGALVTRQELLVRALLTGGTSSQRAFWLPRLATGELLAAAAISEPDDGSNLAAARVVAHAVEGGWLLRGRKAWCSFAGAADLLMVLARTDPPSGHHLEGLSLFVAGKPRFDGRAFDHVQPEGGRLSGRAVETLGCRGMHTFELLLEDYFVPHGGLIGGDAGRGQGYALIDDALRVGRLQTAARATGLMQAAFDRALAYAEERHVFGRPLAEFRMTAYKLARMATLVQAARQSSLDVARMLDAGKGRMEVGMIMVWASRAAEWVTREAMQVHGARGYTEEEDVSRLFVDARALALCEGADEVVALRLVAREVFQRWLDHAAPR